MAISQAVGLELRPTSETTFFPFRRLLDGFIERSFARAPCRAFAEKLLQRWPQYQAYMDLSQIERGGLLATPKLLYPESTHWTLFFSCPAGPSTPKQSIPIEIDPEEVPEVAEVLRYTLQSEDQESFRVAFSALEPALVERLLAPVPKHTWPRIDAPGIYRLEHASLLFRSRTTSLLLDPICMIGGELPYMTQAPRELETPIDGILITHQHGDHWNLPSILRRASSDVPVIVPQVPRVNLLCSEDFSASLRLLQQKHLSPSWGTTLSIGDIEIDVLPFYGEQPTRASPGPEPSLRSWGNCYRVSAPDFSAIVLVDSGADPEGNMEEVLASLTQKYGPVDVVLSCLREFDSPFFGGLEDYWATLPFARVEELFLQYRAKTLPSTTAGCLGAAALCERSKAAHFLPYANGFEGVGRPITDVGWGTGEPSEELCLTRVAAEITRRGAPTQVHRWSPGDTALFDRHQMTLRRT